MELLNCWEFFDCTIFKVSISLWNVAIFWQMHHKHLPSFVKNATSHPSGFWFNKRGTICPCRGVTWFTTVLIFSASSSEIVGIGSVDLTTTDLTQFGNCLLRRCNTLDSSTRMCSCWTVRRSNSTSSGSSGFSAALGCSTSFGLPVGE